MRSSERTPRLLPNCLIASDRISLASSKSEGVIRPGSVLTLRQVVGRRSHNVRLIRKSMAME